MGAWDLERKRQKTGENHDNMQPFLLEHREVLQAREEEQINIFRLAVELGKFDPPLWHAPYGRIV